MLIVAFLAERERSLARRLSNRRALVSALVRGEPVDPHTARRSLGIDLADHQLGLVCWAVESRSTPETTRELERAARRIADVLRCPSVLTLAVEDGLWAWAGRGTPFRSSEIESLRGSAGSGVGIAVGSPAVGPEGFRRTQLTALATRHVTELTGTAAGVTVHRDVALLALPLVDPERAA